MISRGTKVKRIQRHKQNITTIPYKKYKIRLYTNFTARDCRIQLFNLTLEFFERIQIFLFFFLQNYSTENFL